MSPAGGTPGAGTARLLCRTGSFAGSTFELDGDVTIGRQHDNDVVLDSELLSRQHARIWEEDGAWWVEDRDSRNGTRVDGTVVEGRIQLARLNVITLADAIDLVFVGGAAAPAASEKAEAAAAGPSAAAPPSPGLEKGKQTRVDRASFGPLPDALGGEGEGMRATDDDAVPTQVDRAGFSMPTDLGGESETMVPEESGEPAEPGAGGGAAGEAPTEVDPGATRVEQAGFGALPDLEAEREPAFSLAVTLPGRGPARFRLHPGRNVLGRSAGCDVTVSDDEQTISREHAALLVEGERFVLEDLGSANGTWVGDERIERATLGPGDTFRLGPYLQFTVTAP